MSKHNIYLSEEGDCENKVVIKGNKLNLRWFDKCILVWSEENSKIPLPKKFLEIIEKAIKDTEVAQDVPEGEKDGEV